MPIHPIGKVKRKGTFGSPYSVQDFYSVNPDYGSKQDLRRLVAEAHRLGLKVIIDVVANHTAWDSVMMKTHDFYTRDASGGAVPPVADWSDVADLNYDNLKLRGYMIEMMKYWISEFDLDGFRCDVAGMVPTDFWEQTRLELEKVKPDIMMLAEWHEPELLVKAFDLDYAWQFHTALTEVIQGRAPASRMRQVWEEERTRFPSGALHLRFSDNHDERRAIARFGEKGALAASALVFTMDGVPLLYNGMEVGDTTESGAPALFERMPIFWEIGERRPEFPKFYREVIALRRKHGALRQGATEWIRNSDESRVVSYLRSDAAEEFLVVVNLSNRPFVGIVEVASGGFVEVTPGSDVADRLGNSSTSAALPALVLDAWEFRIWRKGK
jgi:glycosidase